LEIRGVQVRLGGKTKLQNQFWGGGRGITSFESGKGGGEDLIRRGVVRESKKEEREEGGTPKPDFLA